jgi:hypothetical protein
MSADDGVYILQTQGPEFRIAHTQAIDNIYEEYFPETNTWSPCVERIVQTFGASKVYEDLTEAWDDASILEDKVGSTEYGTSLITQFSEYHFSDFEEQNGKVVKSG